MGMKSNQPEDVLKNRTSVCAGYAGLFEQLAKAAGLIVCTITGHARNLTRDVGQDLRGQDVGGHAWNAVNVEDRWVLIDCTWGAGTTSESTFSAEYNPYYFDVLPGELVRTHHPTDPNWQLLKRPISYEDFISGPIVCDAFFKCGLSFPQQELINRGHIALKDKNVTEIRFHARPCVQATAKCGDDKRSAMVQRDGTDLVITAECPLGEHQLSIFTRGPDSAGESYQLALKYRITVHKDAAISNDSFPILYGIFDGLGAVLDAPKVGCLKKGM